MTSACPSRTRADAIPDPARRLFPYLWTYAQNLAKDGRPIARPLGLAYPEMGIHPNDVYLLGDNLLIAPVLERGVTSRDVPFPPGRWVDYWTGEVHEGGSTGKVAAPLGVIPVFLREGGIVPMLRPTIDAMAETTDPARVDSYATTPGVLYVRVAAGAAEEFTVFDGAKLRAEKAAGKISLGVEEGAELHFGAIFEVIATGAAPGKVTADGAALDEAASLDALSKAASGWYHDPATGGTLYVHVGPKSHTIEATF